VIILPEVVSAQGVVAAERLRHNVETKGALAVAERIRQHIEMAQKEEAPVTVSIGVASYPEHGVMIESLIKAADDAVYLAKRSGKNRVVVAGKAGTEATPPGVADG
jgi:diguanylate cyclase (GGDEF)-like protein